MTLYIQYPTSAETQRSGIVTSAAEGQALEHDFIDQWDRPSEQITSDEMEELFTPEIQANEQRVNSPKMRPFLYGSACVERY